MHILRFLSQHPYFTFEYVYFCLKIFVSKETNIASIFKLRMNHIAIYSLNMFYFILKGMIKE
jgi:hypothetical protein